MGKDHFEINREFRLLLPFDIGDQSFKEISYLGVSHE